MVTTPPPEAPPVGLWSHGIDVMTSRWPGPQVPRWSQRVAGRPPHPPACKAAASGTQAAGAGLAAAPAPPEAASEADGELGAGPGSGGPGHSPVRAQQSWGPAGLAYGPAPGSPFSGVGLPICHTEPSASLSRPVSLSRRPERPGPRGNFMFS